MVFLPVKPLGLLTMSMRERANGSNIVHQSLTEAKKFRFAQEIFRCYGYLFFHIQSTWWRNLYFMLNIK